MKILSKFKSLLEKVDMLVKRVERIEHHVKVPDASTVVAYIVTYDYETSKYHNGAVNGRGYGTTMINVDGGVTNWNGLLGVREFLKHQAGQNTGLVVKDVNIKTIQEINRWNKEMTPQQEQSLRQSLAQ